MKSPEPHPKETGASLVDALSRLAGLPVPREFHAGVEHQLELNRRIIEPLLSFDIPEGTLPEPEFEP